jgi:pyruvate formate lyase activating enzyme
LTPGWNGSNGGGAAPAVQHKNPRTLHPSRSVTLSVKVAEMDGLNTLAVELNQRVCQAAPELVELLDSKRVRCLACGHRCPIPDGQPGVCKVRFNRGGQLYAPYGYVNSVACDPIEKKPFFHVRPGAVALSFGMLGCDLHCSYCQNWVSSQALRDPASALDFHEADPKRIVQLALRSKAEFVVSTYNEPLITAEWAVSVFREARAAGLRTGFVSNGNATPEVLEYLRPWIDAYKVDLKSFSDRRYHELGGRIGPILDTIHRLWDMGVWLEIVTLLVPGFNDSDDEIGAMTRFLAGVSPNIPWHVTAFHPDYRMVSPPATKPSQLMRAAMTGMDAGLRYIYLGNIPGMVGGWEDTRCPACRATLVRRAGFCILENRLGESSRCPECKAVIAGLWDKAV